VGLEKLGAKDFQEFFSGELFIDENHDSYKALGFTK
jgi:hypothetical protein